MYLNSIFITLEDSCGINWFVFGRWKLVKIITCMILYLLNGLYFYPKVM